MALVLSLGASSFLELSDDLLDAFVSSCRIDHVESCVAFASQMVCLLLFRCHAHCFRSRIFVFDLGKSSWLFQLRLRVSLVLVVNCVVTRRGSVSEGEAGYSKTSRVLASSVTQTLVSMTLHGRLPRRAKLC